MGKEAWVLFLCVRSSVHSVGRRPGSSFAGNCFDFLSGEKSAQLLVGVASEEFAEIFVAPPKFRIRVQQPLDGCRNVARQAAVADGTRDRSKLTDGAADAEIVGVHHFTVYALLFAFNADVGDPVLAATVRASGHVKLKVLLEAGKALFELLHQPAGEGFRFGDGHLAEFRAGAGDGTPAKGRGVHAESGGVEFICERSGCVLRHVYDQEILHVGGAKLAGSEAVRQIGGGAQLAWLDAAAKHGCSHVGIGILFLRMDAGVIAVDVSRRIFRLRRIQMEAKTAFEFVLKLFRGPAVLEEQEFQAGTVAALAQNIGTAENFRDAPNYREHLVPADECVQALSQVRLGRKAAAHAEREASFQTGEPFAHDGGKTDIVNFRIGAPDAAASDRDFEFAREIVEVRIAGKQMGGLVNERRSVADFVRVHSRERAAGDIARHIAAGGERGEAAAFEAADPFGQTPVGHPVKLNVLAPSEASNAAAIFFGEVRNGAKLVRVEQAVWDTDAHHEKRHSLSFTAGAADSSGTVALRIDAPPSKVCAEPFGRNRVVPLAGKAPYFREILPGIQRSFQPLDFLGFCFFGVHRLPKNKKPTYQICRLAVGLNSASKIYLLF